MKYNFLTRPIHKKYSPEILIYKIVLKTVKDLAIEGITLFSV